MPGVKWRINLGIPIATAGVLLTIIGFRTGTGGPASTGGAETGESGAFQSSLIEEKKPIGGNRPVTGD